MVQTSYVQSNVPSQHRSTFKYDLTVVVRLVISFMWNCEWNISVTLNNSNDNVVLNGKLIFDYVLEDLNIWVPG